MIKIPDHKQLILFDGVCNLCNNSVQYVIKRDHANVFMFAPLQSEIGAKILKSYQLNTKNMDSIILYIPNKGVYSQSTAALKIASKLTFPTKLLAAFMIIPPFIRNAVYNYIAKHRYSWYGKQEHCMIPTPELRAKFLE